MRIAEIIEACRQPGVPGTAQVVLRYSNGLAGQERVTRLTKTDLLELAALAQDALFRQEEEVRARRDDRRESDRHPPRTL
jgi:hypothetical protein